MYFQLFRLERLTCKQNTSHHYSMMLLAETLMCLIRSWSDGPLGLLPQGLVQDRVLVVLIQIFNRTLLAQHTDGSRGEEKSAEVNAYCILTLLTLHNLPHISLSLPNFNSLSKLIDGSESRPSVYGTSLNTTGWGKSCKDPSSLPKPIVSRP